MRGSTHQQRRTLADHGGSPAHAGIDLPLALRRSSSARLPRACGDRPASDRSFRKVSMAPPRMRGSTLPHSKQKKAGEGSPAHAGIDRCRARWRSRCGRLPRACGDRPHAQLACAPARTAPPRMRGSTPGLDGIRFDGLGSPAHAGIDPHHASAASLESRLPRACGDRPPKGRRLRAQLKAPPRMRGSTRDRVPRQWWPAGSPAHAGIDPATRPPIWRWTWLPRACGDRPDQWRICFVWDGAPPRMRGSTVRAQVLYPQPRGSPAHAGIDHRFFSPGDHVSRLPRACGDRPTPGSSGDS